MVFINVRLRAIIALISIFLTVSSIIFYRSDALAYSGAQNEDSAAARNIFQAANLVSNSSFESGDLSSWEVEGSISAVSGAGYNNSYAAQMNGSGRLMQLVATTPGQKYNLTGWLRVNRQISAPSWGGVRLQVSDVDWTELGRTPLYSTVSSQWIAVAFTFTAASSESRISFENFSGGGQFEAVLDDVAIRPSLTATATPTLTPTSTPRPTNTATPTPTVGISSLITNGDFETGNLSGWEDYGGLTIAADAAFAGRYGVRMNDDGRIDQPFTTVSGQSYTVRAKLRIEQQRTAPDWGGLALLITNTSWQTVGLSPYYTTSNAPLNQWVDINFSFTAHSSSSRISFQNFSNGKFIATIDNITVSGASTATATPTNPPTATPIGATSTPSSVPTATPISATATPTRVPISGDMLEGFEDSQPTWLVSSWLSGSGKLQRSTTTAAEGQASALLRTSGSPARAQLQVSFSNSATDHSWEERPGNWNWQRAMVYVPSASVNQLQSDQYFTLAGFYPSNGGAYGWYLRVKANGQLMVYGYTANGKGVEFPSYTNLPLDRWVSLELGLHSQAGPGVKRSFAFIIDGDFYGWYRQGNMGSETFDQAAFGILDTNSSAALQVSIDAWQKASSDQLPGGPDNRSSSAVQTQDFRTQSGVQVQYDWSTWALQPTLHSQYGLSSEVDRIQAGRNIDRMPDLRNGWAEIEIDWPHGNPMKTPQDYFGPMVGFRKEINREQNLEIIPIGNGNGTVDLALEAWIGSPIILARWPMPTASIGGTSIPEPGDIIRVRWEELSASSIAIRASYYDASAARWHTDIINGSYDLTAVSNGLVTVNFMDGYHTASSITIDSSAYSIRRYTVGELATYPNP